VCEREDECVFVLCVRVLMCVKESESVCVFVRVYVCVHFVCVCGGEAKNLCVCVVVCKCV